MSSRSNPGRLYNRRVTRHIKSLLPERVSPGDDFTFGGKAIVDRENNPGKPAGGTCEIKCYVGEDGQLAVLEKSELAFRGEVVWACWNRIRRTHTVDAPDLPPFRYHVQTQILDRGNRKRDETIVSLAGLEEMPVYGGREAQAALLLAESLAVEKAVAPEQRSDVCCSLHRLPSLPRLVDRGEIIRLSWRELDELVGPDAEMIAANASVERVPDEEREEAVAKGVKIFTDEDSDVEDEQFTEGRTRRRTETPDEHERRERDARSLPDDMSPEEAEEKLIEMAEEIYEMRAGEEGSE
ncbi:hypothetical protein GRX03_08785 [Halovenus sp. WSH3]|uniref:Uncharacterized protein n=1 Tax=Halovenus carboxidivorans TaxID=2692199 RepID=A0A6B0T679_9EURY|nr:hypothetical protein [Halovenus carboxidivorans]MXR51696.1 hypothetical protein [Halovenus carboxidivorans]